jgi:hypothetical protein
MIAYGLLSSEFRSRYSVLSFLMHWTLAPIMLLWHLALCLASICGCNCLVRFGLASGDQQQRAWGGYGAHAVHVHASSTSYSNSSSANGSFDGARDATINIQVTSATSSSGDDNRRYST